MSKNTSPCIEINNLSFQYPLAEKKTLDNINLTIQAGEYVVITGSTGSGKTTLALCLNGIIPNLMEGELSGEVLVNGLSTREHPIHELTPLIGLVFQNPEDQLFSLNVTDEIAFGVENMGYSRPEIIERVNTAIQKVHLEGRKDYSIFKLSGGQKQKVAIASNLALSQDILVLDSPTADLDPISSAEVVETLVELRRQNQQRTFIVIDSDISDVVQLATRIIVLDAGKIILDGAPATLLKDHFATFTRFGIRIPEHIRRMRWLHQAITELDDFELEEEKIQDLFSKLVDPEIFHTVVPALSPTFSQKSSELAVSIKNVSFQYEHGPVILKDVSLDIHQGEWVAIIGENGTGKSTTLKMMAGLTKPQSGEVKVLGRALYSTRTKAYQGEIGYLFQNPDHQLFMPTLEEEIGFAPNQQGCTQKEVQYRVDEALSTVGLENDRHKHPFTLSRGQRQRLAVATVLAARPKLLLLDEPTTGQDQVALDNLMQLTQKLIDEYQTTVVMVTHDMDLVTKVASRVILLNLGKIQLDGCPSEIFVGHAEVLSMARIKIPFSLRLASHFIQPVYFPKTNQEANTQ